MTSHTRAIPRRHNNSCRKSCSDYRSRTAPPKSPTQDPYQVGGGGRIRTSVGISRQIYSLFPLAAREPHRGDDHHAAGSSETLKERTRKTTLPNSVTWSQRRDSNPRPTDYKSVALPAELRWHCQKGLKACCDKRQKSPLAFKKSFNRRFDPACQVKFRGIIGRILKKSTLFLRIGPSWWVYQHRSPPAGEADRSLTKSPVSVLWTWQSAVAPALLSFEPRKRANHKKDRFPYGRRFPAACCRDLQFVSDFVLQISNLAPACPGWDMHA